MSRRSYTSPVRTAAAAERRERVIKAAADFLRESEGAASFSLDAVAKMAGVTRLTLYNQFGSRRGLLDAVFDDIARRGGLGRIRDVQAQPDPRDGIDYLIRICCEFWSGDPVVQRLYDAMALAPELEQALAERNERRRQLIELLVERIATKTKHLQVRRDIVDLIFAYTSLAMFRMLARERSPKAVGMLIQSLAHAALDKLDG